MVHVTKVEVSPCEVLPQRDIERDLGIVIVIAQVQVFPQVVLHHKGLVAVQTAPPAVWVEQRRDWTEVTLAEGRDQALVEPQFIEQDLGGNKKGRERGKRVIFIGVAPSSHFSPKGLHMPTL